MCGIVGYVGRKEAAPLLIEGLRRLEYRGYDSAGICALADQLLQLRKRVGRVEGLAQSLKEKPVTGSLGISHKHDQNRQRPSVRRHKQQSLTVAPNLALCRACGT